MSDCRAGRIVCGLDVGNGYVKGKASIDGGAPIMIDLPSTITYTTGSPIPDAPSDALMADLVNRLDATVVTRSVPEIAAGRAFFGRRAVATGASQREFDIESHEPKCREPLSMFLVLGSLASLAVADVWADLGSIPTSIDVAAGVAVALPIEDYVAHRADYEAMLTGTIHHVIVHNFERDVDVAVTIDACTVLAEGAAAQYAITDLGEDFLQTALDAARAEGADIDDGYTGASLVAARDIIGIDVGEGTVNFPVFTDGDISIESSTSIPKGYGTVLSSVVAQLRSTPYAIGSRKALAEYMLDAAGPSPARRRARAFYRRAIDRETHVLVQDIMMEYSRIFARVGVRTDVVYVYGGGASEIRSELLGRLRDASRLDEANAIPIIYLDSAYSRDLNRTGLYNAALLRESI